MRPSDLITLVAAAILGATAAMAGPAPKRVVSINLCTDQLAMLLADEGQLVSVSRLASDPFSSAMADEARAYPRNFGRAEEVYVMRPDLVLAGSYTTRATVDMLRQVGVEVMTLGPVNALDEVPDQIRKVAKALGHEERGEALIDAFNARRETLRSSKPDRPTAALYHANGYSLGGGTMADDILANAGFINVTTEMGREGGSTLPLESLVMANPDLIISAVDLPGASRAEELLDHPALVNLRKRQTGLRITSPDWICGTPYVLNAVDHLATVRREILGMTQ